MELRNSILELHKNGLPSGSAATVRLSSETLEAVDHGQTTLAAAIDGGKDSDFKGRTLGIGPVLSYATKIWKKDLVAEVKWLPEMDVEKRLKGDTIWFKLGMVF